MDELALLEDIRSGDQAAFAALVDRYSPLVYRLALRMLGNPQDAEDVLQETFIKVYQHLDSFNGHSRLSTWIYRIATNETLMLLRKRKGKDISLDVSDGASGEEMQEPLEIIDWSHLPEDKLLDREVRSFLEQAVDSLSEGLRAVFLLRDVHGLSIRETAEALEISEVAVKTRLSRARLKLREALSNYYREQLEFRRE